MKQLILMGMFLVLATMTHAQIDFQKFNWEKLTKKAAAEDKLIVVDMTATWCYWCKVMDKKVFSKKKVGEYYNANFISTKLYDTHEMGSKFASEYSVGGFPTLLFLNSEGKLVHKIEGAVVDVNDFLSESEKAVKNKGNVINNGGNEDKPTAESLAAELLESVEFGDIDEEEYEDFLAFKGNKGSVLELETTWMLAMQGQIPAARQIIARRVSFVKEFGNDAVNEALMYSSTREVLIAAADFDPEDAQFINKLQKAAEEVLNEYFDDPDYVQAGTNIVIFGACIEYELENEGVAALHEFIPAVIIFAKDEKEVAELYLGGAEMMLELVEFTTKKDLQQAVEWAKKATSDSDLEIDSYQILSELHEELGENEKAKEYRNKVMQD